MSGTSTHPRGPHRAQRSCRASGSVAPLALRALGLCLALAGCSAEPSAPDASVDAAPEVDAYRAQRIDAGFATASALDACVGAMADELAATFAAAGCPERAEDGLQGPYFEEPVIAACLELTCANRVVDGHNGIPAARSCFDLDELERALRLAADEAANDEGCAAPRYRLRILDLAAFAGGEPCDQLECAVGPDGTLITRLPSE